MAIELKGSVVAITGASSGIGRSLALYCANAGANLALADVDEQGMAATATQCEAVGSQVMQRIVDVGQRAQVTAWADSVVEQFSSVNMIINNAGVNLGASVEATSQKDFEWVMDIDFWGVVYGSQAFLPHLRNSDWGHIVNVSSLFGLMSMPNQSAYNAAKFAVKGFSDSLRMEMVLQDSGIGVSSVHPGGIKTNIVNSAKFADQVGNDMSNEQRKSNFNDKLARTTPDQAANIIMAGVNKNKSRILVGTDAKIFDFIQRMLPSSYQKIALAFLKKN